ncbi:Maf family protein [Marinimicrobium sp. C2-29]|uniref:Maf family protein n=1 Tax=Marinimicrobium sp. C2-29 TaxID=3139825 RepID=UPI003139C7D1
MPDLYLASQSPRRRELLTQMGVDFDTLSVDVVEQRQPGETPADYVERLARDKALAGRDALDEGGAAAIPVLGADTIGVCSGEVLEKPRDQAHAAEMHRMMSGRRHEVLTAVALCLGTRVETCLVRTSVQFRELSENEISAYWHTGEPLDKAGGYGIQGLGGAFVERIEGSYSAVVGLPLAQTADLLNRFGVPWWSTQSA